MNEVGSYENEQATKQQISFMNCAGIRMIHTIYVFTQFASASRQTKGASLQQMLD
jgi:hypothetical protein